MKLREWLKQEPAMKLKDLAYILGVSKSYIHRWFRGERKPSKKILSKIQKLSENQVSDFQDLKEK